MKNSFYNVAIDSDGVVCSFSKKCSHILKRQFVEGEKIWGKIQYYNDNVEPFFETLEKEDDADILMDFIFNNFENYFILTAAGHTPKDAPEQKRRWYAKYYPNLKVEVVTKSPDKAAFACPKTILIDDRAKSIDPWVAAGGIGILHKNSINTIEQLKHLLI